jgi:hypothetical protein
MVNDDASPTIACVDTKDAARALDALRPADLTPAEWARRAGYTPQLIADFRNHGKNITLRAFLKLVEALGARVELAGPAVEGATEPKVDPLQPLFEAARDLDEGSLAFLVELARYAGDVTPVHREVFSRMARDDHEAAEERRRRERARG